ncbi:MAG: hypothetical protein FWD47_05900 [Treponema sp.]|nr:hypothetical protein [Treponema sp.]
MAKAKKAVKKPTEVETLAKELKSLIPKLNEEGLAFLVKQANIHIYNMQVDELNNTIIKEKQRDLAAAVRSQKTVKTVKTVKTKVKSEGFTDIKMTSSGYHILYGRLWISFTKGEITSMVKIVKGEGSALEISERLFNWLSRERTDILITASIANKFNDELKSLISLLKMNFKIKK